MNLINSPFIQRLRWISQLTSVSQAFPGAEHSRFSHSLGTMHLAGKYMIALLHENNNNNQNCPLDSTQKAYYTQLARLSGLLHDFCHGAFSHLFDNVVYQDIYGIPDGGHDLHRVHVLQNSSQLQELIHSCGGIDYKDIINVWNSKIGSKATECSSSTSSIHNEMIYIIGTILHGPIVSADRCDFILRDSLYSATSHFGTIAKDRIISCATLQWTPLPRLHFYEKCIPDIIHALNGRRYMYENVYLHRVASSSSILLREMFLASKKMMRYVDRVMNLDPKDPDSLIYLTDYNIIGSILNYSGDDGDMLRAKEMCLRYLNRDLPKLQSEEKIYVGSEVVENDDNRTVCISRTLSHIDPTLLDKFRISILTKDMNSISCEEAFRRYNYTNSSSESKSYYIKRIYQL